MHTLTLAHGESAWTAALIPLSVDGMIIASSMTLLADSRVGGAGGGLPWALLGAGSTASLAANMAVAEPTAYGRVIAAWPSFALIGAYELLMRQIRHAAPEAVQRSAMQGRTQLRAAPQANGRRTVLRVDADLLERARRIDAEHRAAHDRPASAETLRTRLRIGAKSARALKDRLRVPSAGSAPPWPKVSTG
jgi:hypothetical protein